MCSAEEGGTTKPSVSAHFRVWTDVFESLEEEAKVRRVSLNALVNQLLSSHTRDDVLLEELGYLKMRKDVFRVILEMLPDDKMEEFGRLTASHGSATEILARSGAIDLEAVLENLRVSSRFGWFSVYEKKIKGRRTVSLIHDFGPKYSMSLGAAVSTQFALVGIRPKIMTTDSSVMVEY